MAEFNLKDLKRYPENPLLQAYDAADELLLEEVFTRDLRSMRILILNDSFGALTISLKEFDITSYSDSYVSTKGAKLNSEEIQIENDLGNVSGEFDLVLLKLPKSHSFFEDILGHLSSLLKKDGELIIGAMVKHLPPNIFDLIHKYIGETKTSLAKKKARLIFSKRTKESVSSLYPQKIYIEEMQKEFTHHSNLFSRNKLDIGTRFFLEHIPKISGERILDLGCANGIVGVKAKLVNPKATIIFTDDSFMAIKSAKVNYQNFFDDSAEFYFTNSFEDGEKNSIDLVLCNPPFHQNNTIGDYIAFQMFKDAHRTLKSGGKIRIIGNSHLGYQHKLKKIYGNFEIVSKNDKFVIIDAVKR